MVAKKPKRAATKSKKAGAPKKPVATKKRAKRSGKPAVDINPQQQLMKMAPEPSTPPNSVA